MRASKRRYTGSLRVARDVNGIYRGRVEDNQDPLQIGRVKVRVPMIHGIIVQGGISTKSLPWATMVTRGGGYNYGSFIVPEIGEYVLVMFEDNDVNKPVYFGSIFGTQATINKEYGPDDDGEWKGVKGKNEVPIEAQRDIPSVKMLYKTRKGSKIYLDTKTESEQIVIEDENGQGIQIATYDNTVTIQSLGVSIVLQGDTVHIGGGDTGIEYNLSNGEILLNSDKSVITMMSDGTVVLDAKQVSIRAEDTKISTVDFTLVETEKKSEPEPEPEPEPEDEWSQEEDDAYEYKEDDDYVPWDTDPDDEEDEYYEDDEDE